MGYGKRNKLHIVSVVAVIRNGDGKYLVLKRHGREVAYPGMYTFPGGKMEGNNTVEETLAIEAKEEANLDLEPGKVLLKDKAFTRPDGQTVKVFSYLCSARNSDDVRISADFTDYRWVRADDLKSMPHVGIEEELRKADEICSSGLPMRLLQTKSIKE